MIVKVGATPVFVDVEPGTRNLDLAAGRRRASRRARARIMPTHFAGLPCDMDALYALAREHELRVIEDAALAIGSTLARQAPIGSFGDLCVFSFHPNKNMTTIEGGALVVNDAARGARASRRCASTASRACPTARATSTCRAASPTSPTSRRLGLRAAGARSTAFNARRARASRALLRAPAHATALRAAAPRLPPRDNAGHSWNMFTPLLPLDAS